MSLIKMMLVMVSVAAISKTFGLLRFLLRLSFLAKWRLLPHLLTLWVCKLLMLICILTKNVITSCSVTMMLFLHLEVKPLMTLTTVLYLSCALISGHLAALHTKRQNLFQELDAVIHLLMEAKHWGLRKSRNATSLNSRFKSLDTLKVKIISVTFRRVIRTNHKKASKIWRHENIQLGGCQS